MAFYQNNAMQVNDYEEIVESAIQPGDLVATASEGLLKLALRIGVKVMVRMMEMEVEKLAGPKGRHDKGRSAYRHGTEQTKVVCGGAKIPVERPRVRGKGGGELPLLTLSAFQEEDQLNEAVLARLLAGVSCRKYAATTDLPGYDGACTSKSEVSRRYMAALREAMSEFFGRRIDGDFPVIMLDGTALGKSTVVAAMGIRSDGRKQMLGLIDGGSENSEIVKALLADLIGRGLDPSAPRLYVIDGSKALAKAVKDTFGGKALIQRCQVHKKRNVLSHLPESEKSWAGKRISIAYMEFDCGEAERRLRLLAKELGMRYPSAAESLLEGLEETLTVHRLGIPGLLRQTLASTNAIESANSQCAGVLRRVTNFKNGEAALRQAAAGYMVAEQGFRRVKGYKQIPFLQAALLKSAGGAETTKEGIA